LTGNFDTPPRRHCRYFIGESAGMHAVYDVIRKVADAPATVLVQGETGTGKELVALALHALGNPDTPCVALNCSAFAADLFASELFGHEKGSFTGAHRQHRGCFEQAAGGMLFLDEITEMPTSLQAQLLRVLETGRIIRVGGEREISVEVRVVAATNRDPAEAVRAGVLRRDLFYRLNAVPIELPPLRERKADIPLLIDEFVRNLNEEYGDDWQPGPSFYTRLQQQEWPGNVRQLRNAVHRAYLLAGDESGEQGVDAEPLTTGNATSASDSITIRLGQPLAEVEKALILATLDKNDGNKNQTARSLGICPKTLYNRLHKYQGGDTA